MDTGERRNFYYRSDLIKDLPNVGRLPDKIQANIEMKVVEVIYESFVIPGDQDYLTARLLAQRGLPRAFFWAAAQTIEKYLKAFLLLNGKSLLDDKNNDKYKGHSIDKIFRDAVEIDESLKNINLYPHKDINIDNEMRDRIMNFSLEAFIKDIKTHGCANNRYNLSGVRFDTGHLFALDNFVYALRGLIGVPSITDSFSNVDDELKIIFQDNNPLFCDGSDMCHSKIPSKKFQIRRSGSVTMLDILIKHKYDNRNIFALKWLKNKMKLPKEVSTVLKT
jgi:hypothetical protein